MTAVTRDVAAVWGLALDGDADASAASTTRTTPQPSPLRCTDDASTAATTTTTTTTIVSTAAATNARATCAAQALGRPHGRKRTHTRDSAACRRDGDADEGNDGDDGDMATRTSAADTTHARNTNVARLASWECAAVDAYRDIRAMRRRRSRGECDDDDDAAPRGAQRDTWPDALLLFAMWPHRHRTHASTTTTRDNDGDDDATVCRADDVTASTTTTTAATTTRAVTEATRCVTVTALLQFYLQSEVLAMTSVTHCARTVAAWFARHASHTQSSTFVQPCCCGTSSGNNMQSAAARSVSLPLSLLTDMTLGLARSGRLTQRNTASWLLHVTIAMLDDDDHDNNDAKRTATESSTTTTAQAVRAFAHDEVHTCVCSTATRCWRVCAAVTDAVYALQSAPCDTNVTHDCVSANVYIHTLRSIVAVTRRIDALSQNKDHDSKDDNDDNDDNDDTSSTTHDELLRRRRGYMLCLCHAIKTHTDFALPRLLASRNKHTHDAHNKDNTAHVRAQYVADMHDLMRQVTEQMAMLYRQGAHDVVVLLNNLLLLQL